MRHTYNCIVCIFIRCLRVYACVLCMLFRFCYGVSNVLYAHDEYFVFLNIKIMLYFFAFLLIFLFKLFPSNLILKLNSFFLVSSSQVCSKICVCVCAFYPIKTHSIFSSFFSYSIVITYSCLIFYLNSRNIIHIFERGRKTKMNK